MRRTGSKPWRIFDNEFLQIVYIIAVIADPNPHGSTSIWEAGSGSASKWKARSGQPTLSRKGGQSSGFSSDPYNLHASSVAEP